MADILKQNKIPGREQLTRPSEIDALSKYLGHIKEIQNEHTELDNRVLEVKGRNDKAFFPEVALDNSIESLDVESDLNLNSSVHSVPVSVSEQDSVTKLDNTVITNKVTQTVTKLNDYIQPILENKTSDIQSLDNSVIHRDSNKNNEVTELDNSRVDIKDAIKNISLDDNVIKRDTNHNEDVKTLDNSIEKLKAVNRVNQLDDSVETIDVTKIDKLDNSKIILEGELVFNGLDSSIEEMSVNHGGKVVNLNDYIETIKVNGISGLNDSIENLEVESKVDKLEDYTLGLETESKIDKLSETVLGLSVENKVGGLDESLIGLNVSSNVNSLNNNIEKLSIEGKVDKLSDTVLGLSGDIEKFDKLSDTVLGLGKEPGTVELDDSVIGFAKEPGAVELDDSVVGFDKEPRAVVLDDSVYSLTAESIDHLDNSKTDIPEDDYSTRIKDALAKIKKLSTSDDEAFNIVIRLFNDLGKSGNSKWVSKIIPLLTAAINSGKYSTTKKWEAYTVPTNFLDRAILFLNKLQEAVTIAEIAAWGIESWEKGGSIRKVHDIKNLDKKINNKVTNIKKSIGSEAEVIETPAYNNTPVLFRINNKTTALDAIKSISLNGLDTASHTRYAVEMALDKLKIKGKERKFLLEQALKAAEYVSNLGKRAVKLEPGRLPGFASKARAENVRKIGAAVINNVDNNIKAVVSGGSMQERISGGLKLAMAASMIDLSNPKNRPDTDNKVTQPRLKSPTVGFERGNNRERKIDADTLSAVYKLNSDDTGIINKKYCIEDTKSKYIDFATNYLYSEGIQTTILDLCGLGETEDNGGTKASFPSSFEDLQRFLRESPYITTPGKFGNTNEHSYRTQTLAVTNYWEVLMEPFVHDELNGGFSYLPAIQEINLINQRKHGVNTGYSHWIPMTGFDFTTSKLNTKSLGLYDGEIVFPISNEFTNELRITIADDMYRSWAWYFKTVADVSVYSSVPHDRWYYEGTSKNYPIAPTYVDKTCPCVALYKNITFRIRIFIMTPQYSTIRSYDLLCVLKDWAENVVGDVDSAGAGDISLSFSVVGENPDKYVPPVSLIDPKARGLQGDKKEDSGLKEASAPNPQSTEVQLDKDRLEQNQSLYIW